jgi:CubicO group peptidase (beta-lactamase class C family)
MARFSALVASLLLSFPHPAPCGELPRAEPGEVGLAAGRLADLKPSLQRLVDEGKIPGGVALVARHGKVADVTTFGYRDLAAKTPMTEDTIFAVASMTKPITCVAVMTLVEQGKLGLDDPVAKYIPELKDLRVLGDARDDTETGLATVPAKRPVTIRHLLTHTSGISYGVFASTDARLKEAYKRAGVVGPRHRTIADLVERLAEVPLAHQPGEGWTYGFSHDVLGRVVEVASGRRFDQYLQEWIFTPLDMRDTSYHVPEDKRGRIATIYDAGEDDALSPLPKEYGSETYFSGGGGLFSTARDYARFAQMILNGGVLEGRRIIEPGTVAAMTTNQIGELSAFGERKYGLGFGLALAAGPDGGAPVLERYYSGGSYSTNFWVLPRRDLVLVLMEQVVPTNHGGADQVFYRVVNAAIER